MMSQTILRLPEVLLRRRRGRSSHYADIKRGLFVRPFKIGGRAIGTLESEVDALNAAVIAGQSETEIRSLVLKLEAARKRKAGKQRQPKPPTQVISLSEETLDALDALNAAVIAGQSETEIRSLVLKLEAAHKRKAGKQRQPPRRRSGD